MTVSNTIDKIFELLSDKEFKNADTGLLFFPVYIYTYPPEEEYEIRKGVEELNKMLQRPSNSLNSLCINLYNEFIEWLKSIEIFGNILLDEIFDKEKEDYQENLSYLIEQANSERFIQYLGNKFTEYFNSQDSSRVYLLLYGIGEIYPYLRLSSFLKKTEEYVKKYKVIAFYPGEFKNDNFSLFGMTNDENIYRANHLNLMLK